MPTLFIPACGDRIRLIEPWAFDLMLEHRNMKFARTVGAIAADDKNYHHFRAKDYGKVSVTLPSDSLLEVARVYIRQYNKSYLDDDDFNSLTFQLINPKKGTWKGRFWVKLREANKIVYELDSTYDVRVKLLRKLEANA